MDLTSSCDAKSMGIKGALNKDLRNSVNLAIYDHNIMKNCQLHALDNLISVRLNSISLSST